MRYCCWEIRNIKVTKLLQKHSHGHKWIVNFTSSSLFFGDSRKVKQKMVREKLPAPPETSHSLPQASNLRHKYTRLKEHPYFCFFTTEHRSEISRRFTSQFFNFNFFFFLMGCTPQHGEVSPGQGPGLPKLHRSSGPSCCNDSTGS